MMKQKAWITVRGADAAYTAGGSVERTAEGVVLRYEEPAAPRQGLWARLFH